MALNIEVSAGEFLDKLTILEIKAERIKDTAKLENVEKELKLLRETWTACGLNRQDISSLLKDLKDVNKALWDVEDRIRLKEAKQDFGAEFVELARSVYRQNDRRAAIKRELNRILGSSLVEEKSYPEYDRPET
jgi:hypothetical protein